ncbi:latent transforming growth factor beta-binding protein [Sorangium sp. So ce1335]|uniref:latent transforming growth factor beta-binding protein n=1 Tax=Sorangium sp. So ce1335 TaxID=3133335 RepID=UPI003F60935A
MTTAALAGWFAACASSGGGEAGEPVYATVCEARCACEDCSEDNDGLCEAEQEAIAERAERRCQEEHTAYIECVRLEGRCVDGHHLAEVCNVAAAALLGCLEPDDRDHCPTAGDGICDEPGGTGDCPAGTDPADCLSFCPFTGNGICDEPENTGRCPAGTDVKDCKLPPCDHVMDGVCDEPEGTDRCAKGTDVVDCAESTCPDVDNGVCDEPEGTGFCAEGSDAADCALWTCADVDNGVCDEPEGTGFCAEGTDVDDCKVEEPCFYTNNGECDEPEGTGLCAEGSDVNDCRDAATCDALRTCGSETSGCVACANEGSCADELEACTGNDDCVGFTQCVVSCEDGDDSCLEACVDDHTTGATLYFLYDDCVNCNECYYSCGGESVFGC